jgi:hypothetical protein
MRNLTCERGPESRYIGVFAAIGQVWHRFSGLKVVRYATQI